MTVSTALPMVLAAAALALVAGCGSSPDARSAEPRETVDTDPVVAQVGDFPEFQGGSSRSRWPPPSRLCSTRRSRAA